VPQEKHGEVQRTAPRLIGGDEVEGSLPQGRANRIWILGNPSGNIDRSADALRASHRPTFPLTLTLRTKPNR
jgi:hypothetical protein